MASIAEHKALVAGIYAEIEKGEIGPLVDALHEDVVWKHHAEIGTFKFAGEWRGKAAVRDNIAQINSDFPLVRMKAVHMTAEEDRLWVLTRIERLNLRGENMPTDTAQFYRFRDGKIIEFNEILDTALILSQMGRLRLQGEAATITPLD